VPMPQPKLEANFLLVVRAHLETLAYNANTAALQSTSPIRADHSCSACGKTQGVSARTIINLIVTSNRQIGP
jgi:hypothetical protein